MDQTQKYTMWLECRLNISKHAVRKIRNSYQIIKMKIVLRIRSILNVGGTRNMFPPAACFFVGDLKICDSWDCEEEIDNLILIPTMAKLGHLYTENKVKYNN